MNVTASESDVLRIVDADHHDPFQVLGTHAVWSDGAQHIVVRAHRPGAEAIDVVERQSLETVGSLTLRHASGFFEGTIPDRDSIFAYDLRVRYPDGTVSQFRDPYGLGPVLTDFDLHLIAEGTHQHLYDTVGAHPAEIDGSRGVTFAVWAPAARRVSVVGDFNGWDGRVHPMRVRGSFGIWEIFIPDVGEGDLYKFEIKHPDGRVHVKTDPFARRMELRPQTAAVVHVITDSIWSDHEWIERRSRSNAVQEPMSIYEVHPGSWRTPAGIGRELPAPSPSPIQQPSQGG